MDRERAASRRQVVGDKVINIAVDLGSFSESTFSGRSRPLPSPNVREVGHLPVSKLRFIQYPKKDRLHLEYSVH